ncbi:MAG: hypothetical protein WBL45_05200 [Solirubrobacterales bacterium]|jgi:hypothetical protein
MATAGMFVCWSTPVRGREEAGLDVFNEAVALEAQLQEEGAIESFEVVLLSPHGDGPNGFILVRGSEDQIAAVHQREDFRRINARASLVVDDFGVIDAAVGEGIADQLSNYRNQVSDLAPARV